jgi:hypothetical protein
VLLFRAWETVGRGNLSGVCQERLYARETQLPKLAAEIACRGWRHDDKLRHASFKGLRDKADEAKIYGLACIYLLSFQSEKSEDECSCDQCAAVAGGHQDAA